MPKANTVEKLEEEKKLLASQIAAAYMQLTSKQLLEVVIATDLSITTIKRYTTEVKKLPEGRKILEEMNKKIAA